MDDQKQKIVEKIKKLFRLGSAGSGGTEAEIELAATRARELMLAHNVSMADLEALGDSGAAQRIRVAIREQRAYARRIRDFAVYDYAVAQTVNILTDTRCIYRHGRFLGGQYFSSVDFVGEDIDVAVAVELFMVLLPAVRRFARAAYGSSKWDKRHTSYALGFAQRMAVRAREQMQALSARDQHCVALVLRSKTEALNAHLAGMQPVKERKTNLDREAHLQGWHDGVNISLEKDKVIR